MGSAGTNGRGDQQRQRERSLGQNENDDDSDPPSPRGYSDKDGVRLMELVQQFELHAFVRGNTIWKVFAKYNVIEGRTWQSLKQYFRTTVLNNVERFTGTPEDKEKFLQASEKSRRTRKCRLVPRENLEKLRRKLKKRNNIPLILLD